MTKHLEKLDNAIIGLIVDSNYNQIFSLPFQKVMDGRWEIHADVKTPDQQIIINGHRQIIPGQKVHSSVILEVLGDGWIEDEDGSSHREIVSIRGTAQLEGKNGYTVDSAIYPDEDIAQQIKELFS